MKKSLLLFLFTIVSITSYSQTFTWHEVAACKELVKFFTPGEYVASAPNPITTGINSNANVSSITTNTIFNLSNPIVGGEMEFSIDTYITTATALQIKVRNSVTGGGGAFVTQWSIAEPQTEWVNLARTLTIPAGNWDQIVIFPTGGSNASYFDKIKASVSQEAAGISSTPALLAGNSWIYDHGTSSKSATPSSGSSTIELDAANPDTNGNDSPTVMKVVRGPEGFETMKFALTGSITPGAGKINLRVYAENSVCNEDKNIRFSLLSTAATDANGNMGQKVGPAPISIPANKWVEVEVDLANFGAGQQATEYASYDILNVFMNFNDATAASEGSVFYFDALQGPASAVDATTLSINDVAINSALKLYPNPVNDAFVLSKEVESAKIYGVSGNLIQTINNKQTKFDVSHLAKGFYFIEASVNNTKETIRFIKN
jgi:hypothetical protein